MNSSEYEKYVAHVVRNLSISKKGRVFTNRKYQGVRQPGSYEIDIACEVLIDNVLFFLIIVECKNWKTPVDRPQVQKLIQTRDAIGAHKAAFASPVGYTKEAIKVAKANGVALWVIAKGIFEDICGGGYTAVDVARIISTNLRILIYELLEYTGIFYGALIPSDYLRSFEYEQRAHYRRRILDTIADVKPNLVPESWIDGRINFSPESELYFGGWRRHDPIMTELIGHTLRNLHLESSVNDRLTAEFSKYGSILVDSGFKSNFTQNFMRGVIASITSDGRDYYKTWGFALDVDAKCNDRNTGLFFPERWIKNRSKINLMSSNNVVWSNAMRLLGSTGLLEAPSNRRFNR